LSSFDPPTDRVRGDGLGCFFLSVITESGDERNAYLPFSAERGFSFTGSKDSSASPNRALGSALVLDALPEYLPLFSVYCLSTSAHFS
jgi:hypothetical protein